MNTTIPAGIREKFLRFLAGDLTGDSFEQWLYGCEGLEEILPADDYLELISIDYRSPGQWSRARALVGKYVSPSELILWSIRGILDEMLRDRENIFDSLRRLYTMYGQGLYFLDTLAVGFGLECQELHDKGYGRDSSRGRAFVRRFENKIQREVDRMLSWLDRGTITILDEYDELGNIRFLDRRNEEEKRVILHVQP